MARKYLKKKGEEKRKSEYRKEASKQARNEASK